MNKYTKKYLGFIIILLMHFSFINSISFANETNIYTYENLNISFPVPSDWQILSENKNMQKKELKGTQVIAQFLLPESKTSFRSNFNISISANTYKNYANLADNYPNEYSDIMREFFSDYKPVSKEEKNYPNKKVLELRGQFTHDSSAIQVTNTVFIDNSALYSLKLSCEESDCDKYYAEYENIIAQFSLSSGTKFEPPESISEPSPKKLPKKKKTPSVEQKKAPAENENGPKIKRKIKKTEEDIKTPPSEEHPSSSSGSLTTPKEETSSSLTGSLTKPGKKSPPEEQLTATSFQLLELIKTLIPKIKDFILKFKFYVGIGGGVIFLLIIVKIIVAIIRNKRE